MRAVIILVNLAVLVAALAVNGGTASAKDNPVAIGNLYFCSASQSGQVCETVVETGDTVTWSNQAGTHTVTQCTDATFSDCRDGFDSGTLSQGQTFTQTLSAAGTSYYLCQFHPTEMRGRVVTLQPVTPSPTPAPAGGSPSSTVAPPLPSTGGQPGGEDGLGPQALLTAGTLLVAASATSLALARRRKV